MPKFRQVFPAAEAATACLLNHIQDGCQRPASTVTYVFSGSHLGCWPDCGCPAGPWFCGEQLCCTVSTHSSGGSVSQRKPFGASAHMSSGAKATLLPLPLKKKQKKINKISLWPVVTVWHIFLMQHFVIGRHKCRDRNESADICVIAARICGGICSAAIKCAAAICTLINQLAEKCSEEENVSSECLIKHTLSFLSGLCCGMFASSVTHINL